MGAMAAAQVVVGEEPLGEEVQGAASIRVPSPVVLFHIQITLAMGIAMGGTTTPLNAAGTAVIAAKVPVSMGTLPADMWVMTA
jgi:hypothetical protein